MVGSDPGALDPAVERSLAVSLFNHAWTLLDRADRTAAEDDELLHAAHASRFHWGRVGEPVNIARGEWQCSRAYAVLGRAEPALHHARRSLEVCLANPDGLDDFDLPLAHEALARAALVAGDLSTATEHLARARALAAAIAEADDREIVEADLDSLARTIEERGRRP